MDYLISNFQVEHSNKIGSLWVRGNCVKTFDEAFVISESADWRKFGRFDEALSNHDVSKPINYNDYYFLAKYDEKDNTLVMQTDKIGFETVYYYCENGRFVMSDNVIEIIKALKLIGIHIEIDPQRAKEYIAYNNILLLDTIFSGIRRLHQASIYEVDINNLELHYTVYDVFKMTGEYSGLEKCASELYSAIDKYFEEHKVTNTSYSIGLSGGLDSRVGAYFACKYDYDLEPMFIGAEKNALGIRTYDSARAEEVKEYLKLKQIKYHDPRTVSLENKVSFDALHAPTMVDNTSQNMGTIPDIKVLINGIIGGEAFGYFVQDSLFGYDDEGVADYILNNQCIIPQYKSGFVRRVVKALPFLKPINKWNRCDDSFDSELISMEEKRIAKERILAWVKEQRALGLDNLNIWYKFYYYNFGAISKTSYYSSFSNTVPSLPTFLNPYVVDVVLKSDTSLHKHDMPIQTAFYRKLEGLGDIRSQKPEGSINARGKGNSSGKMKFIIERFVRGSGMNYPAWIDKSEAKALMKMYAKNTKFSSSINLKSKTWLNDDQHCFLCLLKIAYLENMILR